MFLVVWTAIAIMNGRPVPMQFAEPTKHETRALCIEHIQDHAGRMIDWVRGRINAPWDAEIRIMGECRAQEKGA